MSTEITNLSFNARARMLEAFVAIKEEKEVVIFRNKTTKQFASVDERMAKHLEDLMMLDMNNNENKEDVMDIGSIDHCEWSGYHMDFMNETELNHTETLLGEGFEVVTPVNDTMEDQARTWEETMNNRIDTLNALGMPWATEKAEMLGIMMERMVAAGEGPLGKYIAWLEESGKYFTATGHKESEEMDFFSLHTVIEQENEDNIETKGGSGFGSLYRVDRYWEARTMKARYALGKFMVEAKRIWTSKAMDISRKEWELGNLLHKSMQACYDKVGKHGGFVTGTGYRFFRWEGALLRTDIMMRSIVLWLTKNKDLAYCWIGSDDQLAFRAGKVVKNQYQNKIGELYNIREFAPLAEMLKECMDLAK